MKNLFLNTSAIGIGLLFFRITQCMEQHHTIQPRNYNTATQSFSIAALKDIAAASAAKELHSLCTEITHENISSLCDATQQHVHNLPEELKQLVNQHFFYQCWRNNYKVAFTIESFQSKTSEYSLTHHTSKEIVAKKNSDSTQETIFTFTVPITCHVLSDDDSLLAIASEDNTVRIFKNSNNSWNFIKHVALEKSTQDHWYFHNLQFLGETLVSRYNNLVTIIPLEDQKPHTKQFEFTVNRMHIVHENHFFIGGFNGRVYSCKKRNEQWTITQVNHTIEAYCSFFPSDDGRSCIVSENNRTNIYSADEYDEWQVVKPLRLPINTDNISYYRNGIIALYRFHFGKTNPIKPGNAKNTMSYYNLFDNHYIGQFKTKASLHDHVKLDLNPPLPATLAMMVFSRYKNQPDTLTALKNSNFLTTLPEFYKTQLHNKIDKKLKKLCPTTT